MCFPKRTNPGTRATHAGVASLLVLAASAARADPAAYVFVPYDDERHELQWAGGVEQSRDGEHSAAQAVAFGFSPRPGWFTQLYASAAQGEGRAWHGDAVSWLNHLQLLPMNGERRWGLGLYLEAEWPREHDEGREATIGPTLQWDLAHAQVQANLLWHRAFGAREASPWQLGYQWQWARLWRPGVEWGLQGFGELGRWDHWAPWADQSHTAGPAVFWKIKAAGEAGDAQWVADAAWLVGVGSGSPRATLRARLRYEF